MMNMTIQESIGAYLQAVQRKDFLTAYNLLSERDRKHWVYEENPDTPDMPIYSWRIGEPRQYRRRIFSSSGQLKEEVELAETKIELMVKGREATRLDYHTIFEDGEWRIYFSSDLPRQFKRRTIDDTEEIREMVS